MDKPNHLHLVTLFLICSMTWTLTGCGAGEIPSPGLSMTAQPATPSPELTPPTAIPTTPSPMPTGLYSTRTAEADFRLDHFLFPAEIDPEIAQVIQLALVERQHYTPRYGRYFTTFVLLKPLETNAKGQHQAYLFTRSQEFYVEGGKLKEAGGGQLPAALTLEEHTEGWHVEMETPAGGDWGTRLREIFPADVLPLLSNFPSQIRQDIKQNLVQQAESYFGVAYQESENGYPSFINTPTPPVVLLTLTPTPTVDIRSLIPRVRARTLVTQNTVSIHVNLYDGLTSEFQKGLVSADWHVYLFNRRLDENYPLENGLLLDGYKEYDGPSGYEFVLHIPLEELRAFAGENRGLVYQVIDDQGEVFGEGEIYLVDDLTARFYHDDDKDFPGKYPQEINQGIFKGSPNRMTEKYINVFTEENGEYIIHEPPGGFFNLTYIYGIMFSGELAEPVGVNELSETITAELYSYQTTGGLLAGDELELEKEIMPSLGILEVSFPHSWLDSAGSSSGKYTLVIQVPNGVLYKEIPFQLIRSGTSP